MIKEIITTSYAAIKQSKAGNFQNVKAELDLLGVNYNDENIAIAYKLIQSSSSLKDSLNNLDKHENAGTIGMVLSEANTDIKNKKQEEKKAAEVKEKKQEASKSLANQKKTSLETAQLNNPYLHIVEYKVIREKNLTNMVYEVNKAIRQGWSPIGGVTDVSFGMSTHGGNSFAQALAKFKY